MATTILTAGIACIIAAIVGGGLKAFGIEIPVLQSQGRQVLLALLGIVLALVGGLMLRSQSPRSGDTTIAPSPAPSGGSTATPNQSPSQESPRGANSTTAKKEVPSEPHTRGKVAEEQSAATAPANGMRVVDKGGRAIAGASVLLIAADGRHWEQYSNQDGTAYFAPSPAGPVGVFGAHEGYAGYYQPAYDPSQSLLIALTPSPSGGSMIIAESTGYIPGLEGRLEVILDDQNRTYLYGQNMAIDGGQAQPVGFTINHPFQVVDGHGSHFELTVVKIIGKSSLINYK